MCALFQVLDVHAALGAEGGLLSWAAGGGVGGDIAILAQSPGDQSTAYGLQAQPQVLTGADQTQTDSSAGAAGTCDEHKALPVRCEVQLRHRERAAV